MENSLSVLVPIRHEGAGILRTLPGLWRCARHADADLHLLVARDAPAALRAASHFAAGNCRTHVHGLETTGKFPALRFGATVARGGILVVLDADVHPRLDAVSRLVEPLLRGTADASGARIETAPQLAHAAPAAALLNHWDQVNCAAWHWLRDNRPDARWCLPGALYAVRRNMFPHDILVPFLDDASVGVHLLEAGAEFAYEPGSRLCHSSSPRYADWVRRKFRHRRGWMALSVHRPHLVGAMRNNLFEALDAVLDRRDPRDLLLRKHMRAIWSCAWLVESVRPSTSDSWC